MLVVAGKRPALCGANYKKLPAVFAWKRRGQRDGARSKLHRLTVYPPEKAGLVRERPYLTIRLKDKKLPIRGPVSVCIGGWLTPARKQAMKVFSLHSDLP